MSKIKIFPQSNSVDFTNRLLLDDDKYVLGLCKKLTFANGEVTVVIEESVRNESIVIVSQPRTYIDIFELLTTIDAAKRSSAKEIIALIPQLPHSRQEKREHGQRTSISARLFADMLQCAGLDRIITMDVHTPAIEGFYNIPFDNIEAAPILINKIKEVTANSKNVTIVSPDFGGMKRVKKYNDKLGFNMAFISKERLKPNAVSDMTLFGSVEDSDVVIIDDLIDTGGTLLKALDLLKENGAENCYIFATHGVFSNEAYKKFVANKNFPIVYVTNTLPQYDKFDRIQTIDISGLFKKAINKIFYK